MISIIIPIYNVENYIEKCIESCICQSYNNIEIIAINDGSTDSSGKIIDSYKSKDYRIKVVHKKNEGVAKARIVGLFEAKGEFVFFLDSDDTLPYNCLELLFNNIEEQKSDIAIGNYCECNPNGINNYYKYSHNNNISSEEYIKLLLLDKIPNGIWGKLYRKELFINPIPTDFKLGEDTTLLIQIISKVKTISFINENVYNYLQREDSAVHIKKPLYMADMYYYNYCIYNQLLLNILRVISQKYGHNL